MKQLYLYLVVFILFSNTLVAQQFEEENRKFRETINKEFRDPDESPLTKDDFETFDGLNFFELNKALYLKAEFIPNSLPQLIRMPTTTDRQPLYSTYGELNLSIDGVNYTLQVYQNQDLMNKEGYEDYLFVPFSDETNGEETYGGGRYLDFRIPKTDTVMLDFNKAYNPYCAYSDRYSCPKVPAQNHIPVRIEAGVLSWKH